jgi:FHS family glucose/mannose:H+ symporter-like MFS transporter
MLRARQLAAVVGVYVFYAILLNSVGTVILQSILSFGIAKPDGSILEGCKDLSIALVSFTVASFLPRLGYRISVAISVGFVSLVALLMPLLPSFPTAAFMFLATGVSFAVVKVSVYSLIGLLNTDPKSHAGFTSVVEGFFMIGVLSGAWIFSLFISPAHPGNLSWLHVYWLLAGVGACVALLWAVTPMPESRANHTRAPIGEMLKAMVELYAHPFIPAFLGGVFLYVLVEQSFGTWMPTYNREIMGLPAAISVQISSLLPAAFAVGRLGGGWLLRRIPWAPFLLCCLAGAAAVVIFALWPMSIPARAPTGWADAPYQAFVLPLAGLFLGPIYPTIVSAVLSALPEPRHAPMMGLTIAFSALGGTFGSFITGQMFLHFGGRQAFALTLAPLGLLCILLVLLNRALGAEREASGEALA